eukprot:TRINITY_DN16928_c0_g1_i1.p1 TRINITY_DN16928_c0_g1~~TRINITY_DN16928_c0_g1_i1.p1  ORF type:complete len:129 (+),score=5.68 TRINITY_DN16928_c0_g1_i1:450-836(+)
MWDQLQGTKARLRHDDFHYHDYNHDIMTTTTTTTAITTTTFATTTTTTTRRPRPQLRHYHDHNDHVQHQRSGTLFPWRIMGWDPLVWQQSAYESSKGYLLYDANYDDGGQGALLGYLFWFSSTCSRCL